MQKTIFIVDDNLNIRKGYALILSSQGYRVQTYECPGDLLNALGEGQEPDLILTDHDMPGMTGAALVAHLRGRGFTKPIVMSSGSDKVRRDRELMRALDGFIPKPSSIADIIACVARALEG